MKSFLKFRLSLFLLLLILASGCEKEEKSMEFGIKDECKSVRATLSIAPFWFDWENVDWMPTPIGQSLIPVPWVGQGSIASMVGLDVANDHKKNDGWELLYSSFDPRNQGVLNNPYFILYNKFTGIMRVYLYLTTQFVTTSTYLQDGITVISDKNISLLNFMGEEIIDVRSNRSSYSQIQPAPSDGSFPLASNKWYMMQYEIAYDPIISSLNYNEIQLGWHTNYFGVQQVSLGGDIKGTLTGTIGGASKKSNIFTSLSNLGKVTGEGVLAGIGKEFLSKNTIDAETGENKLGLPKSIFKDLLKGVGSALSSSASGMPKAIVNLLSAVIGGGTNGQSVNFNLRAEIRLDGAISSGGSFPSSPTSLWVPGTVFPSNVQGYIPLYNASLGVFNLVDRPKVPTTKKTTIRREGNPRDGFRIEKIVEEKITVVDNSHLVSVNPDLKKIAKIEVVDQDIVFIINDKKGRVCCDGVLETTNYDGKVYVNPTTIDFYNGAAYVSKKAVRFIVKVTPYNGTPPSFVIKTFVAD